MDCSSLIGSLSDKMTKAAGSYWAVLISIVLTVLFLIAGPFFSWSDTFILVFNTFLSVVWFIMLFIIQHSSNKDTAALHKKVDELIRSIEKADNSLIGIENK